jgi:hypothetical protein
MKTKRWREHLRIHPEALKLPRMSAAEEAMLRNDLLRRGLVVPIEFFADEFGVVWLLDGVSRLDALEAAGIRLIGADGQLVSGFRGHDEEFLLSAHCYYAAHGANAAALVASLNLHRRHLDAAQRHAYIASHLGRHPDKSDRAIAVELGVSKDTVRRARPSHKINELASGGANAPPGTRLAQNQPVSTEPSPSRRRRPPFTVKRTGRDGKVYPVKPQATATAAPRPEPADNGPATCAWAGCAVRHSGGQPSDWWYVVTADAGAVRYERLLCPAHSEALAALLKSTRR